MKTAIYCRVSTEDQEKEGTSLYSQMDACLKLAQERAFDVPEECTFLETYSGLSLERPQLNELREIAREGRIGAVIFYSLDRLSRDPVHLIILQEEMEKHGVELVLVTETLDSTDLGKLIMHIRGYAGKLEVQRIRERTMRGLRARAKAGKFPSGRRGRLYGYTYLAGRNRDIGEGIRHVNEEEMKWVRQIFDWFVYEGIGIDRIAYKLRDLGVPTPSSNGIWHASEIWKMLRNRAYIGETFVFCQTYTEPKTRLPKGSKTRKTGKVLRPQEEWIELPGATPAIIDKETFDLAQQQLKRNRQRATRNMKQQYLLAGHVKCRKCGRNYWGFIKRVVWGGTIHLKRYYRCAGKLRMVSPVQCDNKNINAEQLEKAVWHEIEQLLAKPERVLGELERKKMHSRRKDMLLQELEDVRDRLAKANQEQSQLLQWALKGFPEGTVISENERLNRQRGELQKREAELKRELETAGQSEVDIQGIERFCELARQNLGNFSYEEKRLTLEVLRVTVWAEGSKLFMTGAIPPEKGYILAPRPA